MIGMTMDRSSVLLILALGACAAPPPREECEPHFHALEMGSPAEAFAAEQKLASLYDDSMRMRLEKALEAAPARTLQLIGDLHTEGSAGLLLERLPYLL